ncbi:MAG: pyrroline-5-carboxylate reductase [Thermoguttaceae bacterium]
MLNDRIGFIGAGQMATALAQGFVRAELTGGDRLLAADPVAESARRLAELTGGTIVDGNTHLVARADVVFLSVKPQQLDAVLEEIRPAITAEKLVVSIVAGVPVSRIAAALGGHGRIVRVMPNTPCLVGRGACGFCPGPAAVEEDTALVEKLLSSVGVAYCVPEKLMDAVTGLSGSGPAFVYTVIEALSDGGVRMGLPRNVATVLAAQTVAGAAEMVLSTGEHTGLLRDRVTSPGGTTIAGVQALEEGGLRAALMAAVEAATERSKELGRS